MDNKTASQNSDKESLTEKSLGNQPVGVIRRRSRLAVSSLISAVAALISVVFYRPTSLILIQYWGVFVLAALIFSLLAFVLGLAAIVDITFNRGKLKGYWCVLLAIFLTPLTLLMTSGVFVNAGRAEQEKIGDGKSIALLIVEYAKDHNDYLPDANQWCDLLIEYHKKLPEDRFQYDPEKQKFKYDFSKEGVCNYAFNRNLSGLRLDNVPYNTVLIFESKGNWNLSGTEELFKKTPRKRQYVYIYTKDAETGRDFPDAVNIKDAEYERVIWEPSRMKLCTGSGP